MSAPGGTGPSSGKKAKAVKKEAGPAVTAASTVATPAPEPVAEEPETAAALETPGEAPPATETSEGEAPRKDAE
jgi:hypothetical protein